MDEPIDYSEFAAYVRQFKTQALLRMLADISRGQWLRRGPLSQRADAVYPHSASLIAFEAMAGWGRQRQVPPTLDDLTYLNHLVVGLADPYLDVATGVIEDDALESFTLRVAFQQFPYQLPPFNELARLRPMFNRTYPSTAFRVMNDELITELIGTDIDNYLDFGPFFLAAVMSNRGVFDPAWLDRPEMAAIAEAFPAAMPPGAAASVFSRFVRSPDELRRIARQERHDDPRMRQYDFNPLAATPFVTLPGGAGLAPQPFFVTSRFAPSAIYYAGLDYFSDNRVVQNDFTKDFGVVNEAYTVDQLAQLKSIGLAVVGEIEYQTGKKSVDVTVEMPDALLMFEVKSSRPTLPSRTSLAAYTKHLKRDLKKAVEQLITTYSLWQAGHAAFAHIPPEWDVDAFIVVPEPLYQANLAAIRAELPDAPFNIAIISFTELEQLVAEALREGSGRVLREAAKPASPVMMADVRGALAAAKRRAGGSSATNPLLDSSFEAIGWT